MREIVVGNWSEARAFTTDVPYAVISFVSSLHHRTPPKIKRPLQLQGRIVIRADDVVPDYSDAGSQPLALFECKHALRISSFVARMAPKIEVLFVHCVFGEGRSAAAAIAIAQVYGLPWAQWTRAPYAPNPYILTVLSNAMNEVRLK